MNRICLAGLALAWLGAGLARAGDKSSIMIGMSETGLADATDSVDVLKERLATLMKEFTGLGGKLQVEKSVWNVVRLLEEKKLQLGIFEGAEFAWAQAKNPKLKPFMIAISDLKDPDRTHGRAILVVRADAPIKGLADLKGKVVSYNKKNKDHVRVFTEKRIGDKKAYFKTIVESKNAETGLDELLEGKVDAVLTDKLSADFYRFLKPGAYRKMRVAESSEAFPAGCVAYLEGDVDAKTLERIQKGLFKANKSERGQDLMSSWNIAAFESVPRDYQADLDLIRKAYPDERPSK